MAQRAIGARQSRIGLRCLFEIPARSGEGLGRFRRLRSKLLQPAKVARGPTEFERSGVLGRALQGLVGVAKRALDPLGDLAPVAGEPRAAVSDPGAERPRGAPPWPRPPRPPPPRN